MVMLGFFAHKETGCTHNIIGVSQNTESGERVVVLQDFGRIDRGRLCYIPLTYFKETWRSGLECIKHLKTPIIHGKPPTRKEWLPAGRYRHFKGGEYNCIGVAVGRDRKENPVMVYQSLYGNRIFQLAHRPYDMFREHVEKPEHNYSGPRFALVRAYTAPTIAGTTTK